MALKDAISLVYLMVVKLLPVVWREIRNKTWNKDSLKIWYQY